MSDHRIVEWTCGGCHKVDTAATVDVTNSVYQLGTNHYLVECMACSHHERVGQAHLDYLLKKRAPRRAVR